MPGWLSTAIIANVLAPGTERQGKELKATDAITLKKETNGIVTLSIPESFDNPDWNPAVKPLEIIDGQHRLLAFDSSNKISEEDYELPVVAFYDLDTTWQAYLFYTINIKPKRINASLAYDLYPILRTQDWLEKSPTGIFIYRETRAQELTEALWSFEKSPWHKRINMLGEANSGKVTQASFIRSLINSFVKNWDGGRIGGLFGASLKENSVELLLWSRTQQAAFLMLVWQSVAKAATKTSADWATDLKKQPRKNSTFFDPPALSSDFVFTNPFSLLASDQGVRGILYVFNDLCFVGADELKLADWDYFDDLDDDIEMSDLAEALDSLSKQPVADFLRRISEDLVEFEWRNSSAPNLDAEISKNQMIYRGSGGYRQIRIALIEVLCDSRDKQVRRLAKVVKDRLGF